MKRASLSLFPILVALGLAGSAGQALAQQATPGFPERIIHWRVQEGETCAGIAQAVYGAPRYVHLLNRYNSVDCSRPLAAGRTLVLPEKVTEVQSATVRNVKPAVNARSPGGAWGTAGAGTPLYPKSSVNTLETGRAGIEFVDRSRVFLAENTLVVVYTTAKDSQVSTMTLDQGEVKAGLSALRGEPVRIDVNDGRVTVESGESVVKHRGDRVTLSVASGSCSVTSGGKTVKVPEHFGTSFLRRQPPEPPHPLPPAPSWAPGAQGAPVGDEIVIATLGQGATMEGAWSEVPGAAAYRYEIARDDGFQDFAVRVEVPGGVNRYEARSLERGTYSVSVRAIDKEEFVGVASARRTMHVAEGRVEGGGEIRADRISANPYGSIELVLPPALEAALDEDDRFVVDRLAVDLTRRAPGTVRLRARGSSGERRIEVTYTEVKAALSARIASRGGPVEVSASFVGLDGIDIPTRVGPRARLHLAGGVKEVPLSPGAAGQFLASMPVEEQRSPVRVDLVDGRGNILQTQEIVPPARPQAPRPRAALQAPRRLRIGPTIPPGQLGGVTDAPWWSPTAPDAAAVGAAGGFKSRSDSGLQGRAWVSGQLGPIGLDGNFTSGATDGASTVGAASWLGMRWRAVSTNGVEAGPALRLALPLTGGGPPPRLELGLSTGAERGRFSWLGTMSVRVRLDEDESATAGHEQSPDAIPPAQGALLFGGTMDVASWARLLALVDGHIIGAEPVRARGGLGLGLEAGGALFGAAFARLSPWSDYSGTLSAHFALGIREAQ